MNVGEELRSTSTGEAVLKIEDAGIVAICSNTTLVALRLSAQDKPSDGMTLQLLVGSLRLISGWIGRTNRTGSTVVTSSATIGIRGTDHEPYVLSPEMAVTAANKEGTNDKVNRGGTTMQVSDQSLDIGTGKVGLVRSSAADHRSRALLTLLLSMLLDKIPDCGRHPRIGGLNLPLFDVPLSRSIMRPSIAVPQSSVLQTSWD